MSNQTSAKDVPTAGANVPAAAERPLRGGKPIARVVYGDDSRKTVRRLYNEMARLPVFQLVPRGPLFAFESRLLKHLEALSDAKEQEIAKAAMRAAAAPPSLPMKTRKSAPARSRRPPLREAAARRSSKSESAEIA